jgi:hypothetical protein
MSDQATASHHGEALAVWMWRYDQARQAGFSGVQSERFANSDRDVGELRRLVRMGCPVQLIVRILR